LFEIGKISMPDTANSRSGKTSVWMRSVRARRRSVGDPTTTAAEATMALPTSTLRSEISRTDMIASARTEPWMNRPVPSTARAPATVVSDVPCSRPTVTSAAASPPIVMPICAT